ncbi:hypothetical protein FAY30_01090 [Bacillus sp. S3]|uniref:hypothetical protein n=1 Tax=Bacillus sp. S3 TaxID=486398 RepID=UPI00118956D2|nr:hypothetical protein [Bacillus sp. S3]QCJ40620.1 hypothetical protein FAY30_01090 [Bacillus sp. S3]
MPGDKSSNPEVKDFEVEKVFEEHVHHERHEFTFKVDGGEFKGHFHGDEIHWFHPHPKQMMGESKLTAIESIIHDLMAQHGISSPIKEFEVTQVFEDTAHERKQFTVKVQGEEFKGFVHEGEIQWFHPQPTQKLEEEHVQAIESEIQEKVADHVKDSKSDK